MAENVASVVIRAKDETQQAIRSITAGLDNINSKAMGLPLLFTGLAGALSSAGIKSAFDGYIESANAIGDLSEKIGATVESTSALASAAKLAGHDISSIETASTKLTKALNDTGSDTDSAAMALKALGLSYKDLKNLDPAEAMIEVSKAMAETESSAGKTAIAIDLFGKAGASLIPVLNDIGETSQFNVKLTEEQKQQAESYEKSLIRLKAAQSAMAKVIASEMAPAATVFVQSLSDMITKTDTFGSAIKGQAQDGTVREWAFDAARGAALVIDAFDGVARVTEVVGKGLGALAAQAGAVITGNFSQVKVIEELYQKDREAILARKQFSQTLEDNIAKFKAMGGAAKDAGRDVRDYLGRGAAADTKATAEKAVRTNFSDYDAILTDRIAQAINKTDVVKARELEDTLRKLDELAAAGLDPAIVKSIRDDLTGATKAAADEAGRLKALLSATDSGKATAMASDIELLDRALANNKISAEQYFEAVEKRTEDGNKKIKEQKTLAEELGLTFSSAFEDAMVSGKSFRDVLAGIGQDILRIITRKNITEPLANALGSFDFSSLFKFNADGGVYDSPSLSRFSNGVYDSPQVFAFAKGAGIFAEAGPEAIMPLKRDAQGRLGVSAEGTGGAGVVVNVINNASGTQATQSQRTDPGGVTIIDVIVEKVKGAVASDIGSGGVVAGALEGQYGLNRAAGAWR